MFVDYEELSKQAEEQGVPINVVNEWYRNTASNPQVKGKSPAQIVQAIGMAMQTAQTGKLALPKPKAGFDEQKFAGGGPVEKGLSTESLPTAYAGPAPGTGPQAAADIGLDQLKQLAAANTAGYRPQDLAAAQAQYAAKAGLPGQSAGLLAAGFGGLDVARANDDAVTARNKVLRDTTVGQVEERQKYVTAGIDNYKKGIDAAGLVVDQMQKSGQFEIDQKKAQLDQKKLQLELIGTQANAGLTQELMNAKSPNSVAARTAAKAFLKQSGIYTDQQIANMVPDTMTGIEAAPIAKLGGDSLEAILKKGQAAQAQGLAAQARASAGKISAETPGAAADSALAQARNASIIGPDGKLILPPGQAMSVSSGGVTLGNSPGTTASQTEVSGDQAKTRQQATHYATSVQGPADKLLSVVQANIGTGLGAKVPASWSNTQSDAAQKAVNKIVAEEAAMNGTPYVQANADTLFKAGPKVVADYVLNLKAEQARRSAKLAMQEQYQKEHNGTLQGFNPTPLTAMKPLYNPVTREVQLMTPGTKAWDNAIANKWYPSETGFYMGKK